MLAEEPRARLFRALARAAHRHERLHHATYAAGLLVREDRVTHRVQYAVFAFHFRAARLDVTPTRSHVLGLRDHTPRLP